MTTTDRKDDEGSFNLKTSRQNIIYNLFYSNISEFSGYLEGIINEVTYKTTLQNMQKLGWKGNYFKSYCVSMVGSGCGVSHYPQFYDRNKKEYQVLPRPYVGSCSGEMGHQFFQEPWIIGL